VAIIVLFFFFCVCCFTSIVLLSLDTIQHIESLSLLFNNYYFIIYNYYLKAVSKDSLRGRSVSYFFFLLSFILYYFAYSLTCQTVFIHFCFLYICFFLPSLRFVLVRYVCSCLRFFNNVFCMHFSHALSRVYLVRHVCLLALSLALSLSLSLSLSL